jgi:hypothetical protein
MSRRNVNIRVSSRHAGAANGSGALLRGARQVPLLLVHVLAADERRLAQRNYQLSLWKRNMQSFTRTGDRVDDGGVRQGHHVPHVPGDRRGRCTPDLAEATAVCIHRIQRGRGHVRRLPVAAIAAQSGRACTPRVGADGLRWSSPLAGRTRDVTSRGRAARHPPSPRRLLRPYVCAR